ncbi:MAG: alpha/beta hydrolase fold domain-containing protein [Lachnospiraceae bacterium]|nr:alpha/beta hydrolase fold domain-containing protein [Lachnospiraceae bacterium]
MQKKIFTLITMGAVVMSLLLSGCSNTTAQTSESTDTVSEETSGDSEEELDEVIGADKAEESVIEGDVLTDVSYLDDGNENHVMDLFGVQDATEAMPGIIEVHGGGFIAGTKEINTEHAQFYRDNGYVVAAPEYSHVGDGADFKDVMQELFAAYHFIAEHAEEYHFDLNQMVLSGDSAGGYYILLSAAIQSSPELQEYFEVEPVPFDFQAIIATCPATDILAMRDNLGAGGPNGHVADTIGEEILNNEELMSHMDLYSLIDAESFPYTYIITTPDDDTTGEETLKLDTFMTENGFAHELHSYESQGNEMKHVFNIINMEYPESVEANNGIIEFLNGYLK